MNNKLKTILVFMLGMIVSYSTVAIADTYINSNEVYYDNEASGGTYTNVKESIDELYNLASRNGSTFGDAIASDILSGKTALSGGEEITGSMINNGSWNQTATSKGNVIIPAGYHDGSGYVSCNYDGDVKHTFKVMFNWNLVEIYVDNSKKKSFYTSNATQGVWVNEYEVAW